MGVRLAAASKVQGFTKGSSNLSQPETAVLLGSIDHCWQACIVQSSFPRLSLIIHLHKRHSRDVFSRSTLHIHHLPIYIATLYMRSSMLKRAWSHALWITTVRTQIQVLIFVTFTPLWKLQIRRLSLRNAGYPLSKSLMTWPTVIHEEGGGGGGGGEEGVCLKSCG